MDVSTGTSRTIPQHIQIDIQVNLPLILLQLRQSFSFDQLLQRTSHELFLGLDAGDLQGLLNQCVRKVKGGSHDKFFG